jgi:hypothetical protein
MGFNLGAFIGGMSRQIVSDIEADEAYEQQLSFFKEKQDILSGAELEKERKLNDLKLQNSIKALKFAGYDDQRAAQIAMSGDYAIERSLSLAEKISEGGGDVNEFYKLSNNSPENMDALEKEITETADAPKNISTGTMGVSGFVPEELSKFFAEPEKIESSYSARLAVISQKLGRDPNRADADDLKSEQNKLFEDLRKMKAAEREEKGTVTPTFDLGSITSNTNEIRRGQLNRYGFEVGVDGAIQNLTEGNMYKADLAELEVSNQLNMRNKGIEDPNMQLAAQGIRESAVRNLNEYGLNIFYNKKDRLKDAPTNEAFATSMSRGEYRQGQVVTVGNKIILYTGVPDYRTGQPFIVLTPDMEM